MRAFALAAALLLSAAGPGSGQLVPDDDWRTLETAHFRVHFTPLLEEQARRAAVNAERAYTQLSRELVPPRGPIDLVIADNVDYVNGYATPFPTNRIVVFAHPPSDASGLRHYDDWNALVLTHELAHVFHLDRVRGIWRIGQAVFGRNPLLFPNAYTPSWVIEGLAVYYESRLTGMGRLEGSEHSMVARAAVLSGRVPTLQELSPATSRFPGGAVVYIYGSLLFDYLSRTRGPGTIREFVERTSGSVLPFLMTPPSRGAFGMSFQTAWEQWRDSLAHEMKHGSDVLPSWRELTGRGRVAVFPRWLGDTTLIYAGSTGKEVSGAYQVTLGGHEKRLGRRNGTGPNVRLRDGSLLFSQHDFLDPYRVRTDLYIERNGRQHRLTRGARLSFPDARSDGEIVAVEATPNSTRLARVSGDGKRIVPITAADIDVQWADPRWSPDGTRIVAVRQNRGRSEIVVLDPGGNTLRAFGATRAVNAGPSWSSDGGRIYFSSDRGGSSQLYVADLVSSSVGIARVTQAATGVFSPEPSHYGDGMAAVLFKADGYHIVAAPGDALQSVPADSARAGPRGNCPECVVSSAGLPPLGATDTSPSRKYSPWASLRPRYWMPVFESSTTDGTAIGAVTSGSDIVGRHDYTLQALYNTRFSETSAWIWYRYAGLGRPLLDFHASLNSSHEDVLGGSGTTFVPVGTFTEGSRIASMSATFVRPRFRTYSSVSLGAEIEQLRFSTDPDTLLPLLPSFYATSPTYPAVLLSAGWSNARRPELSISPEDGVAMSFTARQRWQNGSSGASTQSVVGVGTAYKSLNLPGFAHHVLALRGAVGITDQQSPSRFSAGGVSGTLLDVFPGYSLGEQRRTFGVRGYPAGAEAGIRAYAASLEYRAPLAAPSKGFRYVPLFIDKTSFTLFGEIGRAYCPPTSAVPTGICRTADFSNPVMRSVGAELNVDTGFQLDFPVRFRVGVAFPLSERERFGRKGGQLYGTFGSSF